jgi:hypothetical protein
MRRREIDVSDTAWERSERAMYSTKWAEKKICYKHSTTVAAN